MSGQTVTQAHETGLALASVQGRTGRRAGTVVEAVAGGLKGELSATDLGQLVKAVWVAGRRSVAPPKLEAAQRPATTPAATVSRWTLPLQGAARRVLEDRGAWRTAVRLLIGAPIATEVLPAALLSEAHALLSRAGRPRKQP